MRTLRVTLCVVRIELVVKNRRENHIRRMEHKKVNEKQEEIEISGRKRN